MTKDNEEIFLKDCSKFRNPGIPPHKERLADKDFKAAKRTERVIAILFIASVFGSVVSILAYYLIPYQDSIANLRMQNAALGLGATFTMLGIGIGIVHWAKVLMPDKEMSEARHPISSKEDREDAEKIVHTIVNESGISRRPLIKNTLIAALSIAFLPAINIFRDLNKGQISIDKLSKTLWKKGVRLTHDPTGLPIRAADIEIGSVVHVIPEGLNEIKEGKLNEKAKSVVLLVRLNPKELNPSPGREDWSYDGIVAYSKICTHVGCPVALYEQQTHHLLCPCHQSTFDLTQECKVVFGPANRPLPQLPITVDASGYLIARSDFNEPVGPSYWERS